jgi:uncharacterized membrane protein
MRKGFFGLAVFLGSGYTLRPVRHGQGKDEDEYKNESDKDMSKLRETVLALLQDIGDRSGCHQMPERSFKAGAYVFPVCARCTGVFFGQLSAVILAVFGMVCTYYIAVSMLAIMGIDWLIQKTGVRESTNIRRLVTGVLGGFGLFSIYINIAILLYHFIKEIF